MTNEEIISGLYRGDSKAIKEAIEVLSNSDEDYISRAELKKMIRNLTRWNVTGHLTVNVGLLYDDVMFGIDSLPNVQLKSIESDEDCISRKDAEMCLTADITGMTIEEYISMVGDRLKGLPSVQPKEAYNKGWKDGAEATAYHVELCEEENPTIPMAVIEDIKAEIEKTVCEELNYCDVDLSFLKWCAGLKYSLRIIDKHIEDIGGK